MQRRTWLALLVTSGICLTFSPAALADEHYGSVVKVNLADGTLHVVLPDDRLAVFRTNSATVTTLDGAPSTLRALRPGYMARVQTQGDTMLAVRIAAFSTYTTSRDTTLWATTWQ